MEETPVEQEDPPNHFPLHCIVKEESAQLQWHDGSEKTPTAPQSKFLFLTVEYVDDMKSNEVQFTSSQNTTDGKKISQLDPDLSSSGRYSPLYSTLVIPTAVEEDFQNSVVVLPATSNNGPHINIFVDQPQGAHQLIVQESNGEGKMENSTLIIESQSQDFGNQVNSKQVPTSVGDEKVIVGRSPDFIASSDISNVGIARASDPRSFFPVKEEKSASTNEFTSAESGGEYSCHSPDDGPLNGDQENSVGGNKNLLNSTEYAIHRTDLKQNDLLLSVPEQSNDLLMNHDNLGVEEYSLTEETYNASDDGGTYAAIEEHLNITMEKNENEYLLPDSIPFEDTDTNILQSNLEVFSSHVMDNNGLLLYDKSRLRQHKRHPAEHLGFDYWCEDCDDGLGMKCSRHEIKIIPDKPVLSRARATLPKEYLVINKLNGETDEEGVFARKTIPKRIQFGPVEGVLLKDGIALTKETCRNSLKLLLEMETGEFFNLDVADEEQSNWMRFVRPAKSIKEQNLMLTQQGKSLYFITTQAIPPRHELKVGYSTQYAEKRSLETMKDLSWTCFECPAKFSSSAELQKHLNVHEGDKDYNNSLSKRKNRNSGSNGFSNILRIKENRNRNLLLKQTSAKGNECWSCHRTFPRTYSLKRHLLLVHADKDKENSGILFEGNSENTDKASIAHTLFKKKQSNGTCSEWLCTHCNLTFDNPSVLNLHTLTHAAEDLESEAVSGLPSELSSVYHEGEFLVENGDVQCPQCTQEFRSKRELIDHVSTHGKVTHKKCCTNTSKPFKCDQCYKTFASDNSLQKHMLVHGADETKPYQCDVCFKRFLNNSALSCHLKTHCDKKCFECPICKEEFEQVYALKEHVKIHSSGGHFTCPHCNKVFDGYSVTRKHIRAFHSGHQHICKDCGKLCPTLDKLRMHSLKHSDHREFLCANCGKQFKRKDKLKEHMKRMHSAEREMKLMSSAIRIPNTKDRRFTMKMSPMAYDRFIYKCRNCMVGFKRRGMLVNHLAKRHPDIIPDTVPELNLPILKTTRDYFCQYCDKIYRSSSKRKAHILKNHPGAELPMSNRQKGGIPDIPGVPNPTFSQTVGSVKTTPHGCQWCHKQYASKAKLLQHQRKKHMSLLPQAQQIPRPARNANSPIGSEMMNNSQFSQAEKVIDKLEKHQSVKSNGHNENSDHGLYNIHTDIPEGTHPGTSVDIDFKKCYKGLPDNISNEFLHQTVSEMTEGFTDYKLSFTTSQEHLLKMMGIKDGTDGISRDEVVSVSQVSRSWSNMPPYPPR